MFQFAVKRTAFAVPFNDGVGFLRKLFVGRTRCKIGILTRFFLHWLNFIKFQHFLKID